MSINAKIIRDSISPSGKRITTWVLEYPRFIHAEFMTHRVFSRNAASSRAIPIDKFIETVKNEPASPVFWGKNQSGMQAAVELDDDAKSEAQKVWLDARDKMIESVRALQAIGAHKQISNRLLEPWFNIKVVATATEYKNFFELRAHKDAQPEFKELAFIMKELYDKNDPDLLLDGQWHIPFGDNMPESTSIEERLKIATARCARVSYYNFEGEIDPKKDYALYDKLFSTPFHASPFEHCAQYDSRYENDIYHTRNFVGFVQYRAILEKRLAEGKLFETHRNSGV